MMYDASKVNPVREQDRAEDLLDNWRKYGYVMFPQQRRIYEQLAEELDIHRTVLEAGSGSGQGTAMIDQDRYEPVLILGTDVSEQNCKFAQCLYPWIDFKVWDIQGPFPKGKWWQGDTFDAVVAVEVIEHVANPQAAIRNLIAAARKEVWISTPNGRGKPRPPENPFHVREYTVEEMSNFINYGLTVQGRILSRVEVLGWEDFKPVPLDTDVSPLVYRVKLR